ncbi:hypothetical protein OQA88_6231 [Cercophora sp. LCS_1]
MRPRLLLLRQALAKPSRTSLRAFAQSTVRTGIRARPQLPFLSVPTGAARATQRVRYLTTERKAQLKYEIGQGIKYTGYIWIAGACFAALCVAISQELLEREYPTPHEWSYYTRMCYRSAHCSRYETNPSRSTNWINVLEWIKTSIERLEDPKVDGRQLKDAPSDRPKGTKDISDMPEPWRRGYFEAMMMYAKAAEHLDGWVRDKTRNMVFPANMVVGPSNPWPRPIPAGVKGQPREENCELAYEPADDIYMRLISTEGLTTRQRIDAGIAFASWLEFNGTKGPASILHEDAIELALSEQPLPQDEVIDRTTFVLKDSATPSRNLLLSLTTYATFRARCGDLSTAFPILVSLLKARRSIPKADTSLTRDLPSFTNSEGTWAKLAALFKEPAYPGPPPSGALPPARESKELCEEAALNLYIGEILFATQKNSREDGLAWTRDAVDLAEEQLRSLTSSVTDRPARTTCRECLATGLDNWLAMVSKLADEEATKKAAAEANKTKGSKLSLFRLWGNQDREEDLTRWKAEVRVIEERTRRSKALLDDLTPPGNGLATFFSA